MRVGMKFWMQMSRSKVDGGRCRSPTWHLASGIWHGKLRPTRPFTSFVLLSRLGAGGFLAAAGQPVSKGLVRGGGAWCVVCAWWRMRTVPDCGQRVGLQTGSQASALKAQISIVRRQSGGITKQAANAAASLSFSGFRRGLEWAQFQEAIASRGSGRGGYSVEWTLVSGARRPGMARGGKG
ncbi:hypothetical protein UVI_02016760 [Ustilaginoidea virens]|uniref:Uncharacterized protein n=1 Tax=Ustilaginoidea virens TaxID=1159556 RepID=A0A1B5L1I4_USTVR|nr:hypothetical protein UVI_02016760 [Ustilaginoidea virens]